MRKHWKELAHGQPGRRFQDRHRRKHEAGHDPHRALKLGAGIVLVIVGLVLLLVPGPGSVLILVGAAFLAEESLILSRGLDRLEVRLRKLAAFASTRWRRASTAAKSSLILVVVALAGGVAWAGYSIFLR
jgi:uncharacterized protein (TIGR02611 family)